MMIYILFLIALLIFIFDTFFVKIISLEKHLQLEDYDVFLKNETLQFKKKQEIIILNMKKSFIFKKKYDYIAIKIGPFIYFFKSFRFYRITKKKT